MSPTHSSGESKVLVDKKALGFKIGASIALQELF